MSVPDQDTLPSTTSCKREASIESQASNSLTTQTKKPRLSCRSSVIDTDIRVEATEEDEEDYWTKPIHQVLGIEEYYEERKTLTEELLKEFNAQQEQHSRPEKPFTDDFDDFSAKELQEPNEELLRVAEEGGYNLGHIRGIAERGGTESRSKTVESDMVGTHDPDFRPKMEAAGIHVHESFGPHPKPDNLHDIQEKLKRSNFASDTSVKRWQRYCTAEEKMGNEATTTVKIIRYLEPDEDGIPFGETEFDLLFTNLKPMYDGAPPGKPDMYDGAEVRDVDGRINRDFSKTVIPTTDAGKPCVPNCFVEIKGPRGITIVVEDQACFDGAVGARGMHELRKYLYGNEALDNKAYSFAATYEGGKQGILILYTVHPFRRVDRSYKEDEMEYNMSKIKGYMLTESLEDFVAGVNALQNMRDMARKIRTDLVKAVKVRMDEKQVK